VAKYTEAAALTPARESLYRLLARLYILEVDLPLLTAMQSMTFPPAPSIPALEEGYGLLSGYLSRSGGDALEDLAVDYAGVFLAAGIAHGLAAFPYESVYLSKEHMHGQPADQWIAAAYAKRGLTLRPTLPKAPEDHAAMELAYMARLCRESIEAPGRGEGLFLEQKAFFQAHLNRWMPLFCQDVVRYAQTDFYRGLGQITAGFLQGEAQLFQDETTEPPAQSSILKMK